MAAISDRATPCRVVGSPTGELAGLLAFCDALATSKRLVSDIIGQALETLQILSRHDFGQLRRVGHSGQCDATRRLRRHLWSNRTFPVGAGVRGGAQRRLCA